LRKSPFAQKVARFVVKNFWSPVGEGAKPKAQSDYTIATLFDGRDGLERVERNISQRVQQLAGFEGLNTISERVKAIVMPGASIA
jgi:hypothetical protein